MQQLDENQRMELSSLIEESPAENLAARLDEVPAPNLKALWAMVEHHKQNNVQRAVIRYQVVQDVASLVSGYVMSPLFSKPFLTNNQ
jgi:hypothetical protein